jgi:hypothetical protein
LRYCGDYRPYFTIHDSDFKNFTQPSAPDSIPSLILGVTNPFFLKVLSHWPHVITIGAHNQSNNPRPTTPPKVPAMQRDRVSKHVTDYKEGIQTTHKAHVEKDEKILKQIVTPSSSSSSSSPSSSSPVLAAAVNNELLRRHFLRLTESFLVPLERYFTSLMPLAKNISLFSRPPRLKPFNKSEFLDILSSLDKQYVVQSKSKELELYRRFLSSVNFHGWFNERKQSALQQLNLIYRKLLLDADIVTLLKGRSNVEVVDLYMRLREQLIAEENRPETEESNVMCARLRQHLQVVATYLPSPPSVLTPPPPTTTGIPIVTK